MLSRLIPLLALCNALAAATCTPENKIAAMAAEIKTIRSHSPTDAEAIPYGPLCYRIFTITPNETNPISITVPAGVNALSTRALLLALGTVLDAGVPQDSVSYSYNTNNGSLTVDYIQTDGIALQRVNVREIAAFNDETCEISGIVGYVRGAFESFTGGLDVADLVKESA